MFRLMRCAPETWEIRYNFEARTADELPPRERRAFMALSSSLDAVNAWLAALAADADYSIGTGLEYGKVLLYALEWLAQEPVRLSSQSPVGRSLLTLEPVDVRTLHAWLALPAKRVTDRLHLVKTGRLPPGYRNHLLSPATRHLRKAALASFRHWLSVEYRPPDEIHVDLTVPPHRFIDPVKKSFGTSGFRLHRQPSLQPLANEIFSALATNQATPGPIALTLDELRLVFDAIPIISHGRNAANRNSAIARTMLWGMLRESEVPGVSWEALDGQILWVLGKGQKRRPVPLVEESTWSYLTAYTNELLLPLEQRYHGAFFRQLDHEERPITKHTVEHLIVALKAHFRATADRTALDAPFGSQPLRSLAKKLHTHIFRVTGATIMAAAGMRLVSLSFLLGHADPTTTLRYYVAAEQLALPDAVKKICQGIMAAIEGGSSPGCVARKSLSKALGIKPLCLLRLGHHPKQAGEERDLAGAISLGHPVHLPLSQHVQHLVAL